MRRFLMFMGRHAAPLALTLAAVLFATGSRVQSSEAPALEPDPEVTAVEQFVEVAEMVEDAQLTAEEAEAIRMEDERIEAALLEQGYYRDDIPLTYLEQDYLHTAADEFGVDYHIMVALIEQETDFRNIFGDGGNAYGYCQIWPKWWGGLMVDIGTDDLTDPYDNFRTAAAILNHLTAEYGDIENALTYYNTGAPGKSEYASEILANAEKWREA